MSGCLREELKLTSAQDTDPKAAARLIELRSIEKSFGSNLVLAGVDFDLRAGEVHALCGENGAGKSTCLGMLYGLHQPSDGSILRDRNCGPNRKPIARSVHGRQLRISGIEPRWCALRC